MTHEYVWITCHGPDYEVMGAVGCPVQDMSPEAVEVRAQARREWLERRYPGPATGRDPEEVRLIAERKRQAAQGGA
jgi:hypothetical protein